MKLQLLLTTPNQDVPAADCRRLLGKRIVFHDQNGKEH
jgi:hypothetical protein